MSSAAPTRRQPAHHAKPRRLARGRCTRADVTFTKPISAPAEDGQVHVDCHLAYNACCTYDDPFSCALSPPEGCARVPIGAGGVTYTP